jgi:hypothetical protein
MPMQRGGVMKDKCDTCGNSLAADGIKDLIPLCHACYISQNAQVAEYLQQLKEWDGIEK